MPLDYVEQTEDGDIGDEELLELWSLGDLK